MARSFRTVGELTSAVGEQLGHSDWVLVDQQRIDTFADATGDHQWIHVDPARAAAGPYRGTIAHGYLTLSLLPAMVASVVSYEGWRVKVNYGSDRVRFPQPVPVGSRLRAEVQLAAVTEVTAGVQVRLRSTVEIEDPGGHLLPKPALVAETLTLLVP